MLPYALTHAARALLAAAVPPQAPIGFTRIKSRTELPAALARLAAAKPLPLH